MSWHWCDSGWAVFPFAGACCCQHSLKWDLAAALPRELPGPFSGADADTHPNPEMRSWCKYVSQSEVMVPRRGFISLHHSGSLSETLAGRERKRDLLGWTHRGPAVPPPEPGDALCLITSHFISSSPSPCYLQPALKAAVPFRSSPCWHLGFLHRMGTAEGAVGQASPRQSHPACSRLGLIIPPPLPRDPGPRDPCCPGAGTQRGGEGCVQGHLPQPCRAPMHFREQVRSYCLLHNSSDGTHGVCWPTY